MIFIIKRCRQQRRVSPFTQQYPRRRRRIGLSFIRRPRRREDGAVHFVVAVVAPAAVVAAAAVAVAVDGRGEISGPICGSRRSAPWRDTNHTPKPMVVHIHTYTVPITHADHLPLIHSTFAVESGLSTDVKNQRVFALKSTRFVFFLCPDTPALTGGEIRL